MVTANTVCVKSPKGQEEIERRTHGLTPRLRQMLIMMDGRRDMATLQTVLPAELAAGEEDPFLLGQIFMINLAKRIPGFAGDGIIAKLQAAQDIEDLRALHSTWNGATPSSRRPTVCCASRNSRKSSARCSAICRIR